MQRYRTAILGLVFLLTLGDSCSNGVVGVQDYGSVTGRVLDATTNRPIANAIVSVGSLYTATADGQGAFTFSTIPVGVQTVTARSPGYTTDSADVEIAKNKTGSVGYLRLVPVAKPASLPTLPPPATPTPAPEPTATPATGVTPPAGPASAAPAASTSPAAAADTAP